MQTNNLNRHFSSPEQLAATAAHLFFKITDEWKISDSLIAKTLECSVQKVKSLKRKSAYFSEYQMLIVGEFIALYNEITKSLDEKPSEKGKRSRVWLYGTLPDGRSPLQQISNIKGLAELKQYLQQNKLSV